MGKSKFYKAKYIVVWNEGQHKILEDGYLEVTDGTVGGFSRQLPEGAECEDLGTAAITPGFINLHCHPSEVYGIKSFIEDCGNRCFYESTLMDFPFPSLGLKGAELQTKLNLAEILLSGCTTALIYGGPYSSLEADTAGRLGMRAYVGAGIRAGDRMEAAWIWNSPDGHSVEYSFDEESGFQRIHEAEELVKNYDGSYDGRVRILLGPTQTMTCTPDMLKKTRELADKLGVGITIHGAEDLMEFEACVRTHGKTPIQLMADTGMLGEDVVVAHCVYIQGHDQVFIKGREDLRLLGDSHTTVAHCPTPFARIGASLQSFPDYRQAGVNMGIGTDTFPSDFIREMRLAAIMAKMVKKSNFATNAGQIFDAATLGGAKAFGRTDIGRLAPGAKADFLVFDLSTLEMTPARDIIKNIVYSASRHSVSRVYVGGSCLARDGQVEGMDLKALTQELQEIAENAWNQVEKNGKGMDDIYPMTYPRV